MNMFKRVLSLFTRRWGRDPLHIWIDNEAKALDHKYEEARQQRMLRFPLLFSTVKAISNRYAGVSVDILADCSRIDVCHNLRRNKRNFYVTVRIIEPKHSRLGVADCVSSHSTPIEWCTDNPDHYVKSDDEAAAFVVKWVAFLKHKGLTR